MPLVYGDVHALTAGVVSDGQALDAPAAGQAVAYEGHAPDFIDSPALVQRHAFERQVLLTAALGHRQVGAPVQPVNARVADHRARNA